ncbi:HAMP domain-containing sensor histidine kinase [Chitinophaga sp.]|uniref:sensor histidine kinase n=1 Tax=Chitinophaga sp. TaxID=1869181 RepID=UPI002630CAA8|nr:HAMP domain-containing sensor histidine kinase [uncultured Chitinophaga sp.]
MLRTILRQKRLSEVRNDFINNMTHELKTPIATVSAAVEALERFNALADPQKTANYLRISRQELQRLGDLVEKVLHIAAEEKEDLVLQTETTDLNDIISEIISNHRLKSGKKTDFTYTMLSDPLIKADPSHLTNAINNLVDNAIKYSGEHAEISILLARRPGWVRISVIDNGIGIPYSYHNSIFEKFFRVPSGNLHNVKGFGLGLSYVKKIAEKHGGTIKVKSEPEKGSEFQLEIPAA